MVEFVTDHGTRIHPLRKGERYGDASPALRRMGVNVDAWPMPPAGLFVVEERTIYLRSLNPLTIGHEFFHALDCALGGGVYRSGSDPEIRAAFANAQTFVTPYAASGLDEYFAESGRAVAGINSPASPWPQVSPERLRSCDPAMYDIMQRIFADFAVAS